MQYDDKDTMLPVDDWCDLEDVFPGYNDWWNKEHGYNNKSAESSINNDRQEEAYREYQEANYNEYFDWAKTYRYTLYR